MANHCIEVTCINCGATYCIRGCNYDSGPSPLIALAIKDKDHVKLEEYCKHCGKKELILN